MLKVLLAAGVAATALTSFPASAGQHITGNATCAHWRHGTCLAWRPRYNVGYAFGPSYDYVDLNTLPGPIVTRYHLGPRYRYVSDNGFVYVVNPRSYSVIRVIPPM